MSRPIEVYKRHFLVCEFALSVLLSLILIAVFEFYFGRHAVLEALKGNRQGLYTTFASVAGSLLGFVLAAVSIILVFGQMPQMRMLRQTGHFATIFLIHFSAITWLGIMTILAFMGLLADTDARPRLLISYIMMWLAILAAFRVYRCVWVLRLITSTMASLRQTPKSN